MKQRLKNLKKMHDIVLRMYSKEALKHWLVYVPAEDVLKDTAEDIDLYDDCVNLFVALVFAYGSEGISPKE